MDKIALDRGIALRRQVVGAEYADKSLKHEGFGSHLQLLITAYGWGEAWSGEHLPLKTRSFLMIVMLATLNRPAQLRVHVLGALNNGATPEEIEDVLAHVAVVCGAPCALDALKIATEVIDEARSRPAV